MEPKIEHKENASQKSLEERTRDFIEGMRKEMEKDPNLKKLNLAELLEFPLLMYEKVKAERLTREEYLKLKTNADSFVGWIGGKVHRTHMKSGK